jgi:hydroquinone glucosyltransferase
MEPFASTTAQDQRPHVVLLASPGAGHLIPLAELARRFADHHGVTATLVTFSTDAWSAVLSSLPGSVATATLAPAVPFDNLPADARMEMYEDRNMKDRIGVAMIY